MKRKTMLLCQFFLLIIVPCFAKGIPDDAPFISLIKREFNNFKEASRHFGISLDSVVFIKGDYSHVVNGDNHIYLNLSELESAVKFQDDDFKKSLIKVVLAHEIGHKVQGSGFGSNPYLNAAASKSIFLECDADVLAGIIEQDEIYTVDTTDPRFNIKYYNRKDSVNLAIVFMVIEHIDKKNLSIATHPSHLERASAFYAGKTAGGHFFYLSASPQNSATALNLSQAGYDLERTIFQNAARGIGYQSSGTLSGLVRWAHQEAMLITNENQGITRNLVRYATHLTRHHNGANSSWDYQFKVYNGNGSSVRLSGLVYTQTTHSPGSSRIFEFYPLDAKAFDLIIGPGKIASVSGQLYYKEGGTNHPEIVLPGDWLSKYWAYSADLPAPDPSEVNKFEANFEKWDNSTSLNDIKDLINLIFSRKEHLFDFTKGIGVAGAETVDDIPLSTRSYTPNFMSGDEDDQQIIYSESLKKIKYAFNAVASPDSLIVGHHFDEILDMVRQFTALSAGKLQQDNTHKWQNFFDEQNNKALQITYKKDPYAEDDYIVEIFVYGVMK